MFSREISVQIDVCVWNKRNEIVDLGKHGLMPIMQHNFVRDEQVDDYLDV